MLKNTVLIAILVGSSVASLAWSQEDPGSGDDAVEASDESAADEAEADEHASSADEAAADESSDADAAADESAGMADAEDSGGEALAPEDEDESAGDVADGQGEEEEEESENASADDSDAGDQADESGGLETGADVDAANPVSDAQPTPVAPTPVAPAPATPAVHYRGQYRMPAETAVNGNRQSGIVKQFDEAKGHGLIMPDKGGQDLFVHSQSMQGNSSWSLAQGQAVTFKTVCGRNGQPQADEVQGLL